MHQIDFFNPNLFGFLGYHSFIFTTFALLRHGIFFWIAKFLCLNPNFLEARCRFCHPKHPFFWNSNSFWELSIFLGLNPFFLACQPFFGMGIPQVFGNKPMFLGNKPISFGNKPFLGENKHFLEEINNFLEEKNNFLRNKLFLGGINQFYWE